LVDVANVEQVTAGRSHISNLSDDIRTKTLLDVKVIAIGIRGAEVWVHREDVDDPGTCDRLCQGSKDELAGSPDRYAGDGIGGGHWVNACRIVLHADGSAILGVFQIEKWDHVGRVIEHTKAAADQGVAVALRLIGKAYARAEAGPELFIDVGPVDTGDGEPVGRGRIEAGQVMVIAVGRPAVVVAQSIVKIQTRGNLPRILGKNCECIFEDLALGVSFHDVGGGGEASRQEIRQGKDVAVVVGSWRVTRGGLS